MKERMKESVCERASEREGEREEKGGHTRRKSLGDRIDPDLTWTRSLATGARNVRLSLAGFVSWSLCTRLSLPSINAFGEISPSSKS